MFNLPGKYNKSKCVCVQIYGFKVYKAEKRKKKKG